MLAALPNVADNLINICLEYGDRADAELDAWDRLLNRINTCVVRAEEAYKASLLRKWHSTGAPQSSTDIFKDMLAGRAGRAVIVADRGREADVRRALRRMRVFNYIPSSRGAWEDGSATRTSS